MTIDAHHHFWKYSPEEYGWIDDEMAVIRRDFLPADLRAAAREAGVDAVVSVQARQTVEETRWLRDLAGKNDFIAGVVGWVPLVLPDVGGQLKELAAREPKLKGVRHVLQGEADERYMLRDDFNAGIRPLKRLGLAYDVLIFERHLPQTIEFVDRHPGQVFVLDHVAKPRIRENILSPWRENIRELARRENVYCKISGMVTEADYRAWKPAQLRPYVDVVLDAFGPERLMAGSDWPVCLVACGYSRWWQIVREFIAALSPAEQSKVLGGTAARAYRLS
jgi:L-fuconolactonase